MNTKEESRECPQTIGRYLIENPPKFNGFHNPMIILSYVKEGKVGMVIGDIGSKYFFHHNVPIETMMWSSLFPLYISVAGENAAMTPIPDMHSPANMHPGELITDMPICDWLNSKGAKYRDNKLTFTMLGDQIFDEEAVKAEYDEKHWLGLTLKEAIYACLSSAPFVDDDYGGDELITLP